ncbi:MAG: hypothetical protein QXP96_03460, partial [Thermoproteota archaeon]
LKVRTLSNNLIVRNVKIRLLDSGFEKAIGDILPGELHEVVLEVPSEHRTNPITLALLSDNTIPYVVKIWKKQEFSLIPISILPLLVAIALKLRNRNFKKRDGKNDVNSEENNTGKTR